MIKPLVWLFGSGTKESVLTLYFGPTLRQFVTPSLRQFMTPTYRNQLWLIPAYNTRFPLLIFKSISCVPRRTHSIQRLTSHCCFISARGAAPPWVQSKGATEVKAEFAFDLLYNVNKMIYWASTLSDKRYRFVQKYNIRLLCISYRPTVRCIHFKLFFMIWRCTAIGSTVDFSANYTKINV